MDNPKPIGVLHSSTFDEGVQRAAKAMREFARKAYSLLRFSRQYAPWKGKPRGKAGRRKGKRSR